MVRFDKILKIREQNKYVNNTYNPTDNIITHIEQMSEELRCEDKHWRNDFLS